MYEDFFGLSDKPFDMTPDPRYLYLSDSHEEALSALLYGIRETKGLIFLAGPVGVGKTTILYSFFEQIKNQAKIVFFQGGLSRDRMTFLKDLCTQFGISPDHDSLPGITQAIKNYNLKKMRQGKSVVLLVDEAQELDIEELNHFHYLNNLEVPKAKLLQIIFCGSGDMDERLRNERLLSLRQRVAIRCRINPLSPEESVEYIFHRLHIAGYSRDNLFTTEAIWRIVNYAGGIPRVINVVCDNAMIIAFALKNKTVEDVYILEALENIEGGDISYQKEENVSREDINRLCQEVSQRIKQKERWPESSYENDSAPPDGHSLKADRCGRLGEVSDPFAIEPDQEETLSPEMFRPSFFHGSKGLLSALIIIFILVAGMVLIFMSQESQETDTSLEKSSVTPFEPILKAPEGDQELLQQEKSQSKGVLEKKKVSIQGKDVAGIALEYYGGLNRSLLRLFREANPLIQDWNRLEPSLEMVLPEAATQVESNVDFYSIQILSRRSEKIIYEIADELAGKQYQNIFIIKDPPNKSGQRWVRLCVGIFEAKQEAPALKKRMLELGFHDAFFIKLINKPLGSILYPHAGPDPIS